MSGEHTFGASDDIVRRIRENLPHIEWEQPLSAERERLAADEIERLRAEVQAMRRFIQDTAIDNGITAADSEDRFWRLSDGTYMPQSVIDLVWSEEARRG